MSDNQGYEIAYKIGDDEVYCTIVDDINKNSMKKPQQPKESHPTPVVVSQKTYMYTVIALVAMILVTMVIGAITLSRTFDQNKETNAQLPSSMKSDLVTTTAKTPQYLLLDASIEFVSSNVVLVYSWNNGQPVRTTFFSKSKGLSIFGSHNKTTVITDQRSCLTSCIQDPSCLAAEFALNICYQMSVNFLASYWWKMRSVMTPTVLYLKEREFGPCWSAQERSPINGLVTVSSTCLGQSVEIYCDQTTLGGGWMRLHYKTGSSTCTPKPLTPAQLRCLFSDTNKKIDIAITDDIQTVNTGLSWILLNGSTTENYDTFSHIINCRTPTNTQWSNSYAAGSYFFLSGTLHTMGNWQTAHFGCHKLSYIGGSVSYRIGGRESHTGEFIHGSCNDYKYNVDQSITSKWTTNNVRAFWLRL